MIPFSFFLSLLPSIASSLTPAQIVFNNVSFQYSADAWWRPLVSATPRRRQYAIQDLNIEWNGPRVLLLVGASSSGKSTVLHVVQNPQSVDIGNIRVVGSACCWGMAKFGRAQQQEPLREQLLHCEDGDRLLDVVGLSDLSEMSPDDLSPSERFRFELAREASNRCNIFLLDEWLDNEPTSTIRTVEKALYAIAEETAGIVCVVTHRPERFLCRDRITMLFGCLVG